MHDCPAVALSGCPVQLVLVLDAVLVAADIRRYASVGDHRQDNAEQRHDPSTNYVAIHTTIISNTFRTTRTPTGTARTTALAPIFAAGVRPFSSLLTPRVVAGACLLCRDFSAGADQPAIAVRARFAD